MKSAIGQVYEVEGKHFGVMESKNLRKFPKNENYTKCLVFKKILDPKCGEVYVNMDIPHNDIGLQSGRLEDCCDYCGAMPGCKAWAWVAEEGNCYLKNFTGTAINVTNKYYGIMHSKICWLVLILRKY